MSLPRRLTPRRLTPRRLTIVLGLGQLLTWALTYYIPATTTAPVAATLGVSPAAVLAGFSVALLATGIASPWTCRWIDRAGGRPVLLCGVGVQAAGLLVMAGAHGLVQWYAGWALTGAGMACGLYDAAFATAGRALGAEARATVTGITLLGGFASTLGWPLGAAVLPWLGWRGTLVFYAALLVGVVGPLYLALPATPPPLTPQPTAPRTAQAKPATHRGPFLCMAAFFTIRGGIATVVSVSVPTLLQAAGLGAATAIALSTLIGPAQVAMRLLQVVLGRRVGPLAITWIGAVVLPLATIPLVAAATYGTGLTLAATVFVVGYGLSNGILTIARGTLPLALFGPEGYATRIGQLALPVLLAQAAAPLLSGPAIASWPATWVFAALAALAALSALALLPLPRTPTNTTP